MKKGFLIILLTLVILLFLNLRTPLQAQSNENKLEKMGIGYNELYNRLTLKWETTTVLQALTISYISTTGEFEYPIDFPNLPYPTQPNLDKNNRVKIIITEPVGDYPYDDVDEYPNYIYELQIFMDERLMGTTQFYFDYQLNGTQYENTYYVYNTGYQPNASNERTFLENIFMGVAITVIISLATYLIMNASEKSIFTEEESEEE